MPLTNPRFVRTWRAVKLRAALELQVAPVQKVEIAQNLMTVPIVSLRSAQICGLCRQEITPRKQAQESLILIEKFDLCPNCWNRVPKEISSKPAYRQRWRTRVRAICKRNGWGW